MNLTKKKGFTLIEVVIVLAIAALILIIVFLAVSGAQRSRRDEQRRTDAARMVSAVESYASNHDGTYPSDGWDAVAFLNNPKDPTTGTTYVLQTSAAVDAGKQVYVDADNDCSGTAPGKDNVVAVYMYQEQGGVFCQSNK